MSTQTRAFIRKKNKVARNEKRKQLNGFSYSKNIANFGAFCQGISSSINLLFLKSDMYLLKICVHIRHFQFQQVVVCSSAKIMLLIRSVIIASIIAGVWSADGIHILSKTRDPGCNPIPEDKTLQLRVRRYLFQINQLNW